MIFYALWFLAIVAEIYALREGNNVILNVMDRENALNLWQQAFQAWWLEANTNNIGSLTMSMELYQASCALNETLEADKEIMSES